MAENYLNKIPRIDPSDLAGAASRDIQRKFGKKGDYIDFHIYDMKDSLLKSFYDYKDYTLPDQLDDPAGLTNTIFVDPGKALRMANFSVGQYRIVYNCQRKKIFNSFDKVFKITDISSGRREIKASAPSISANDLESQMEKFQFEIEASLYHKDFVLVFEGNQNFVGINIALDLRKSDDPEILIKLYEPLPGNINKNSSFRIAEDIIDPLEYTVDLGESSPRDTSIPLSGPNFRIDTRLNNSMPSTWKVYDDFLSGAESSSLYSILGNLSGSMVPSVDYENTSNTDSGYHFENFVHFSKSTERLKNFKYKVELLELYDKQIAEINTITGDASASAAIMNNKALVENKKKKIIGNLDHYEKFLFFEDHPYAWPKVYRLGIGYMQLWGASAYQPPYFFLVGGGEYWVNPKPYHLVHSTSSIAVDWLGSEKDTSIDYGGQLYSASMYDNMNKHNIENTIPQHIIENPTNEQYKLFIAMVGQYFDEMWLYAEHVTKIKDAHNSFKKGISKDLVYTALRSLGTEVFDQFENEDLFTYLTSAPQSQSFGVSGSAQQHYGWGFYKAPYSQSMVTSSLVGFDNGGGSMPKGDITKEVWKRIYHNLPYLLKHKGTERGIKALMSCYGVPETILHVKEYGGPTVDRSTYKTFNYPKFSYALNGNTHKQIGSVSGSDYFFTNWTGSLKTPPTYGMHFNDFQDRSQYAYLDNFSDYTVSFRIKPHREGLNDPKQLLWATSGSQDGLFVRTEGDRSNLNNSAYQTSVQLWLDPWTSSYSPLEDPSNFEKGIGNDAVGTYLGEPLDITLTPTETQIGLFPSTPLTGLAPDYTEYGYNAISVGGVAHLPGVGGANIGTFYGEGMKWARMVLASRQFPNEYINGSTNVLTASLNTEMVFGTSSWFPIYDGDWWNISLRRDMNHSFSAHGTSVLGRSSDSSDGNNFFKVNAMKAHDMNNNIHNYDITIHGYQNFDMGTSSVARMHVNPLYQKTSQTVINSSVNNSTADLLMTNLSHGFNSTYYNNQNFLYANTQSGYLLPNYGTQFVSSSAGMITYIGGMPVGEKGYWDPYPDALSVPHHYLTSHSWGYTGSLQEVKITNVCLPDKILEHHALTPFMHNQGIPDFDGKSGSFDYRFSYGGDLNKFLPYASSSDWGREVYSISKGNPIFEAQDNSTAASTTLRRGGATASMGIGKYTGRTGSWEPFVETHHLLTPDTVGKSMTSEKVRIDSGSIDQNILSFDVKAEESSLDRQPLDYNDLGVFFSPTFEQNEDIIHTLGAFRLDDYIGDPRHQTSSHYPKLKELKETYFNKFTNQQRYNFWDYIKLIQYVDHTLFKMIEQYVPAKANLKTGLLIEPHYLERNKFAREIPVFEQLEIEGTLKHTDQYPDGLGIHDKERAHDYRITSGVNGAGHHFSDGTAKNYPSSDGSQMSTTGHWDSIESHQVHSYEYPSGSRITGLFPTQITCSINISDLEYENIFTPMGFATGSARMFTSKSKEYGKFHSTYITLWDNSAPLQGNFVHAKPSRIWWLGQKPTIGNPPIGIQQYNISRNLYHNLTRDVRPATREAIQSIEFRRRRLIEPKSSTIKRRRL